MYEQNYFWTKTTVGIVCILYLVAYLAPKLVKKLKFGLTK